MSDGYTAQGQIGQAEFDKKVIIYWWLQALGLMLSTVILIPLIPVWLLVGYFFHQKQFDHLSCVLTDRSINIRSGLLFKKQQNIPLDKITDLSIMGGPFLDSLGISKISIETAGSTPFPLTGVANAEKFRDVVFSIGINRPRPPTNRRPWPRLLTMCWSRFATSSRASRLNSRKIISLYSVTARTLASSQPSAWSRVVSSPSSCRSRASFNNAPNPGPGAWPSAIRSLPSSSGCCSSS